MNPRVIHRFSTEPQVRGTLSDAAEMEVCNNGGSKKNGPRITRSPVALTAGGDRGPRQSLTRSDRLMTSLVPPEQPSEVTLGAEMTKALSRLDGCPEACDNTETPIAAVPQGDGWLCRYCCADCGTFWTTSWGAA